MRAGPRPRLRDSPGAQAPGRLTHAPAGVHPLFGAPVGVGSWLSSAAVGGSGRFLRPTNVRKRPGEARGRPEAVAPDRAAPAGARSAEALDSLLGITQQGETRGTLGRGFCRWLR